MDGQVAQILEELGYATIERLVEPRALRGYNGVVGEDATHVLTIAL